MKPNLAIFSKVVQQFWSWTLTLSNMNFIFLYLDVIDSSIIEQFGEYKDRLINEVTEEKDSCVKRIVCEWVSREDPDVKDNILKW